MKIAFIVSKFPSYDEAFLLRELHAISKVKDTVIFSLRPAKDPIIHDQARELLSRTLYLPFLLSFDLLWINLKWKATRLKRYFSAFCKVFAGNVKSPQFLIRSLVLFPKSVMFADWALKNGVTHMHAYWATYPATVAYVVNELTGIPYSFMGHAHDIYLDTTFLPEKMSRATFISTCTTSNKDHLHKVAPSYPLDRIRIIHHGLDLKQFETVPDKKNSLFEILSVGTLQYYKGFNYLLDALALLKQRGLKFNCTLIGGGPEEKNIKEQRTRLGLETEVTMTGPLKQNEVIPHYKRADVSVLMAQSEWHWGIPNVLIESLAARTAVVTTRFGSVEELIQHEKTGLIVTAKDPVSLADALERYAKDSVLRLAHVEEGNTLVRREFTLENNVKEYVERFGG